MTDRPTSSMAVLALLLALLSLRPTACYDAAGAETDPHARAGTGTQLTIFPSTSVAEPLRTRSLRFTITRGSADSKTRYFLLETVPGSDTGNSSE